MFFLDLAYFAVYFTVMLPDILLSLTVTFRVRALFSTIPLINPVMS